MKTPLAKNLHILTKFQLNRAFLASSVKRLTLKGVKKKSGSHICSITTIKMVVFNEKWAPYCKMAIIWEIKLTDLLAIYIYILCPNVRSIQPS